MPRALSALQAPGNLHAGTQALQCFGEDRLAVGVAAPLLYVSQVSLVGLDTRWSRRVVLVLAGREAAPRALPLLGYGGVGREARLGLVSVRAPECHPDPRRRLAALRLAHRAGAYPASAYSVATTHRPPLVTGIVVGPMPGTYITRSA